MAVRTKRHDLGVAEVVTTHTLQLGDAREIGWIADGSIHLVLTSPPYWTLKKYEDDPGQLGDVADYETFQDQLDKINICTAYEYE